MDPLLRPSGPVQGKQLLRPSNLGLLQLQYLFCSMLGQAVRHSGQPQLRVICPPPNPKVC